MPTYEYRCKACGHEFETMHGMTVPALRKCPKCSKLKLERLISGGSGVIFKGSGFYETDYKQNRRGADSAQEREKRDGAGKPDEAAKTDAKPDTKTEAKGETKSESKSEKKADRGSDAKSESKPKKDSASPRDSGSKKD